MKIALIILGVIALLVFLIGWIRVHIELVYSDKGPRATLRILFFHTVLPPEKPKKSAAKPEVSREKPADEKRGGELPPLWELLKFAKRILGKALAKLQIDLLYADVKIASADPFQTALLFGGAGAGAGAILAVLENTVHVKKKKIVVNADFSSATATIYLECKLSLRIGQIVAIGLSAAYNFLKLQKLNGKHEQMENAA